MAESDGEVSYDTMVAASNRKHKKSGGFQALGLDTAVNKGVSKRGYRVPTPIQRKTIPLILSGKDVVGMARTGSGKTAAFLIPLFQKLKQRSTTGTRALLISPTRELALQTFKFTKEIGKFTGLMATVLVGGDSMEEQFAALHKNPDIIIATPGRLLHVVMEMNLKLNHISYVVFDEADRLFEMGFGEQLNEVLKRLPVERQTIMFSATLPKSLVDFAHGGLSDPSLVRLDVDSKISEKLVMRFICCRSDEKLAILLYLLNKVIASDESTLIFVATKHHVEYIKMILELCDFPCCYLYSALDPEARKININSFRNGKAKILLVTDLAARGVDIPLLDNVINVHFPTKSKLFVHRVGRVARAGRCGAAFSLVAPEEIPYLIDLHLFLGRPIVFGSKPTTIGSGDTEDDPSAIGEFPRHLIDSELEMLRACDQKCSELELLKKTAENAYKQYCRSRPSPSIESIRRSKQESSWRDLPCHPLFRVTSNGEDLLDKPANSILDGLKKYKPQLTIFELNKSSKTSEWTMMKAKRRVHKVTGLSRGSDPCGDPTSSEDVKCRDLGNEDTAGHSVSLDITDSSVSATFGEIVTQSQKTAGRQHHGRRGRKKSKTQDENCGDGSQYFVPYRPRDFHSEQGLAVEKASGFEQAASSAVLDLMADEGTDIRQQGRKAKIWDRKRKRFVGNSDNDNRAKKFRTESGAWVAASYRSGIYEKWKKHHKIADRDSESDEGADKSAGFQGRRRSGFRGAHVDRRGKGRLSETDQRSVLPKRELRRPEEILKRRKRKQRLESYQKYRHQQKMRKGKNPPSGGRKRKGS